MGVQGLTTFVEGNRDFLQDVKFRDSPLVIDGCSLYFRLYFNYGLDQQHGGDYDAFAQLLSQFLNSLAACNIQPYVVLDGGIDPSNKKFSTLQQRLQAKIKDADSISRGRNGSVLPILTRQVFIQVLIQNGIPLVQCPAEADWEIACLAHQWNCPVLTNDSDFFIFDLPGGYLPLGSFQWNNLNGKASHRYISARRYTTSRLCRWFGGMNRELLPLCAVLAGNDYSAPKAVETLLDLIEGTTYGGGGRGRGRATPRVAGLLGWLSSFSSVAEALEEVSRLMCEEGGRGRRGQSSGLSSQLWAAMQEYCIDGQSWLARWFSEGTAAFRGKASGLAQLPDCLSLAAAQGLLAPLAVDASVMRRVLLIPQVENSKLASSHCPSRAIRQAVYGLLLRTDTYSATPGRDEGTQGAGGEKQTGTRGGRGRGRGGRGAPRHNVAAHHGVNASLSMEQAASAAAVQGFSTQIFVEEYDRLDLNLKKNQVEARLLKNHIPLAGLSQTPVAVRLGVLLEVLGVKESALAPAPRHLQLAVSVTGFWLREAVPAPSHIALQALVLGMVYGELSSNNQPGATPHKQAAPRPNWAAEHRVCVALDRQRLRPGERRGVDIGAAHSLSQWQSCLWSGLLFSGTLVHGLLRYLKGGRAAESLLPEGSLSGQLYSSLMDAVRDCSLKTNPLSSASGRKRRGRCRARGGRGGRGRGGGRGGAQGGARGEEEINNRFALLMSEEEYDD
ncbi:unnamed protein product [Menidia menidia]|uniref:(Atlantic silverside) hypothetical protein n=1 Tax=Menidia menidia TaxID=238744 RepID=A0A8S4AM91_9TELE|nr:unnamed protein product [Menidia menidia]